MIKRKPNKISAFERRKWTAVVFASTHVQGCSKYVLQANERTHMWYIFTNRIKSYPHKKGTSMAIYVHVLLGRYIPSSNI
jgi:hypothetical protein